MIPQFLSFFQLYVVIFENKEGFLVLFSMESRLERFFYLFSSQAARITNYRRPLATSWLEKKNVKNLMNQDQDLIDYLDE